MRTRGLALCLSAVAVGRLLAQQGPERNRLLEELSWMEVARLVPESIQTVLLPAGTLEPHGVVNNGAGNTAPLEMARRMAPRLTALIAPTIPYGVTTTVGEYPGTFGIAPATFEAYVWEVVWAAYPFPSSILLYRPGEGYPDFDPMRARRHFDGVVDRLVVLVRDIVSKWDRAGL